MPKDIRMWEIKANSTLQEIRKDKLDKEERLEDWLEDDISIISDELLVIGRQVETGYGGYIDLLCIDGSGDLVVVELKRDRTPREVTAQALDYGSWVKDLSSDEITRISDDYLVKKQEDTFEKSFSNKMGYELPEIINENHKMLIVASELDSQTERIINYLSDTYGVGINAVTFEYFKDDSGREIVGRVFLIDPTEVEKKAERRSTSKRRPPLTKEELRQIAEENGLGDIYAEAADGLQGFFDKTGTSYKQLAFVGRLDNRELWIFNLVPKESDRESGLYYYAYIDRFTKYFDISEEEAREILPYSRELEIWKGMRGIGGYFKSVDEVDEFIEALQRHRKSQIPAG